MAEKVEPKVQYDLANEELEALIREGEEVFSDSKSRERITTSITVSASNCHTNLISKTSSRRSRTLKKEFSGYAENI